MPGGNKDCRGGILNVVDRKAHTPYILPMIREIVRRLAATEYVRGFLEHPADIAEFRERPTPRLIAGLILMAVSYIIGWPAVAALIFLANRWHEPLLAVIGGPAIYGFSCLVFIAGAWLSRAPHYLALMGRYFLGRLFRKLFRQAA
jgi:hypothetical protein